MDYLFPMGKYEIASDKKFVLSLKKKLIKIEIKENLLNMYLYTLKNTIFERVKTIYQTLMFGKMFKKIDKKIVP